MGITAAGDRIPGNLPVPPLEPVPPAPGLSSFPNCHLQFPLAHFQDHARGGEWQFSFGFSEVAAAGMSPPSWECPQSSLGLEKLPQDPLSSLLVWFLGMKSKIPDFFCWCCTGSSKGSTKGNLGIVAFPQESDGESPAFPAFLLLCFCFSELSLSHNRCRAVLVPQGIPSV